MFWDTLQETDRLSRNSRKKLLLAA